MCVCLHLQMPVFQKLIYFVNLKALFCYHTRELKELYHVNLMVSEERNVSLFQIINILIVLYSVILIKVVGQI